MSTFLTSWRGYSPLLFSLQYECNTNVANKLIQFGANVHHQADDGNNALIIASLRRHVEIVRHLIIDKKGKVRKIHTGFNGPATGDKYTEFKQEFEGFVSELLSE